MADGRDIRFCPYCCMMQFNVTGKAEDGSVFCENCGIDVLIRELIR